MIESSDGIVFLVRDEIDFFPTESAKSTFFKKSIQNKLKQNI